MLHIYESMHEYLPRYHVGQQVLGAALRNNCLVSASNGELGQMT